MKHVMKVVVDTNVSPEALVLLIADQLSDYIHDHRDDPVQYFVGSGQPPYASLRAETVTDLTLVHVKYLETLYDYI